jgi:hypothetical protein
MTTRDVELPSHQKSNIANLGQFLFPEILDALSDEWMYRESSLGRAGSCCPILKLV